MKPQKPKLRNPYALHAKMKKQGPHSKKKETREKQKRKWKKDELSD
jgi:hypothetical protein